MKLVIQLLLWALIAFLAYMTFNSIYAPYQFQHIKKERYAPVVKHLQDIANAELAYKQVNGEFTGSFENLIQFIDTAQFTLTQRRDSVILDEARTKAYGVDMTKVITIIDTLGYRSVKDSLFGNSNRYKNLMYVPNTNKTEKVSLEAGVLMKNETPIPVFEAKVAKEVVLKDQPHDLVVQEKQVVSVDAINGAYITVGAMDEINTKGNWPKFYGQTRNE